MMYMFFDSYFMKNLIIYFSQHDLSREGIEILFELSAEIVPNICARFGEANLRTTSPFLHDCVSRDLSKGTQFVFTPFYQLIKLVYTRAYRSLPQTLVYPSVYKLYESSYYVNFYKYKLNFFLSCILTSAFLRQKK